jgi:hypothetical protein
VLGACIAALVLSASVIAIAPGTAQAADRVLGPLSPPSGTWFGATVNYDLTNPGGAMPEVTARETFLGRRYDIVNRFYNWTQTFPTSLESWDVANGRIPMLTWCCRDTRQITSGSQDAVIRAAADRMAAFGSPIFLRFFHEMDGDRRAGTVHTPQDFINAWRHVHDIFVQRGATNVVWVWCPTSYKFITRSPWPPNYYPGDAYVDWIAADGYSWYPITGGWRSWTQIFQAFYDWASTQSKPIMIAENGVLEDPAVSGRKAAWITDSQNVLKNRYPLIQAVLYFDVPLNSGGVTYNWQLNTSQSAMNAYRTMSADPYFNPPHGPGDETPPSVPGRPTGVSTSPSTIDLTFGASTDDVSTSLTYRILRDGSQVGSVTSSSTTTVAFQDSGLAPASTHTYQVVAVDGANNASAPGPVSDPITTQSGPPPPTAIFADDFSSGDFSNWTGVTRLTIDAGSGGVAAPSARAQASANTAWAYTTIPTQSSVCVSMNVNAASLGGNSVVLMRLRTASNGPVSRVFASPAGMLWVKSDVSGAQISSGTSLGTGWHLLELCGSVGATTTWDLYRDGVRIVNAWAANTGTTPVGRVEIGDASSKTFTINVDDVVVDTAPGTA